MKIIELIQNPELEKNTKLKEVHLQFEILLAELRKRELPDSIVTSINNDINLLNVANGSGDELRKKAKTIQTRMLNLLEKELKLVPKNYYRHRWLPLGMVAFGIPIGVAFGTSMGNMAFLGIGLPIGLAIGMAVGSALDKKAWEEGRQLDVEIKY